MQGGQYAENRTKNKRNNIYRRCGVRLFRYVAVRQTRGRPSRVSESVFQEFYRADIHNRYDVAFAPKKENIPGILGRSLCGTLGLLCNFYALGKLNLSDANMLNKLSPFFAIIFSIFLLREKPTAAQVLGVAVAFGGSLLIIKPGFADAQLIPALAGVLGGLGAGAAYTFVRKLGKKGENSKRIVFYFSAFSCLFCLPFLIVQYKSMTFLQTLYLIFAGTFACVGQLGITKAYLCAPAKEISVYDYTQVIFAALLGFFVFGDLPDIWSVLGYILICGAGVAMFFYNKRKEG